MNEKDLRAKTEYIVAFMAGLFLSNGVSLTKEQREYVRKTITKILSGEGIWKVESEEEKE